MASQPGKISSLPSRDLLFLSQNNLRLGAHPCFTDGMSDEQGGTNDMAVRLARIESHLAHLERQYEELNGVVVEQSRLLGRLQKENSKVSSAVENMEMERISANNAKPPHYSV